MTQLVELQEALPKFQAAGIKLYVVSYDSIDALEDFARHHEITYPLLSDKGSRVIDRFGIRNHFVTQDQVPYYGIPFPGTYLVDAQGIVEAKFFHRNLAQRESPDSIVDRALGRILLGDDEPRAEGGAEDIRIARSRCSSTPGTTSRSADALLQNARSSNSGSMRSASWSAVTII